MFNIEYLRSFRVGEYAIFDFVVSFLGVYILSPLLVKLFLIFKISTSKKVWLYLTLPIGILAHLLSGQMTKMTEDFLNPSDYFILSERAVINSVQKGEIKE